MTSLHGVHQRHRIVIAGGGVAALEALLALRAMLGGTVEIELIAPQPEFVYRPIAVAEPFGLGEVRRIELARVTHELGAHLREAAVLAVDASSHTVQTSEGETIGYDSLIVAIGAHPWPAVDGALTFGGGDDRDALEALMSEAARGAIRRLTFVVPPATAWPLPIYELALFTSAWARQRGVEDLRLTVVTSESSPLEAFGVSASERVEELLYAAGIRLVCERAARAFDGERLTLQGAHPHRTDAVVALPGLDGPRLHGLPQDENGFILTDAHAAVRGLSSVWAAGDGASFPIKHGGLAAQQADAAASAIAAGLGAIEHARPFTPVLRGLLLTGAEPRFLRAGAGGSEVSFQPLWWPPSKIAGRYLAPYLAGGGGPGLERDQLTDRDAEPVSTATATEDEHEAVALLLELADANARRGSYEFALKCFDAAEEVGGPLPAARQEERRSWAGLRRRSEGRS